MHTYTLKQLIDSLEPLKNLNRPFYATAEFWTATIASFTALFIAIDGPKRFKWNLIKPKLCVVGLKRYKQKTHYWRLAIKNLGSGIAKNVQVDVIDIVLDGKQRDNFLPIPLRWTHLNCESRDILPEQTVYLDVVEHYTPIDADTAKLITRSGGGTKDFESLQNGISKVTLAIYEESGKLLEQTIEVSWSSGLFMDIRLCHGKWHLTENVSFL